MVAQPPPSTVGLAYGPLWTTVATQRVLLCHHNRKRQRRFNVDHIPLFMPDRRDSPHRSDRKILEGYSERVGEDELRHVFGKMNVSGSVRNRKRSVDPGRCRRRNLVRNGSRTQKDLLPVRPRALHGRRVGRHWPPHGAVEPKADQWKIKALTGHRMSMMRIFCGCGTRSRDMIPAVTNPSMIEIHDTASSQDIIHLPRPITPCPG
jgi:hypothetical protein